MLSLFFVLFLACTTGKESTSETGETQVTLATDIQPIFDRNCIYCHTGDAPSAELTLESGKAHTALVGVASIQLPEMKLVEPGDHTASYLWYKLSATQADIGGTGTRMPPELMLAANELALFEAWIDAGAPE